MKELDTSDQLGKCNFFYKLFFSNTAAAAAAAARDTEGEGQGKPPLPMNTSFHEFYPSNKVIFVSADTADFSYLLTLPAEEETLEEISNSQMIAAIENIATAPPIQYLQEPDYTLMQPPPPPHPEPQAMVQTDPPLVDPALAAEIFDFECAFWAKSPPRRAPEPQPEAEQDKLPEGFQEWEDMVKISRERQQQAAKQRKNAVKKAKKTPRTEKGLHQESGKTVVDLCNSLVPPKKTMSKGAQKQQANDTDDDDDDDDDSDEDFRNVPMTAAPSKPAKGKKTKAPELIPLTDAPAKKQPAKKQPAKKQPAKKQPAKRATKPRAPPKKKTVAEIIQNTAAATPTKAVSKPSTSMDGERPCSSRQAIAAATASAQKSLQPAQNPAPAALTTAEVAAQVPRPEKSQTTLCQFAHTKDAFKGNTVCGDRCKRPIVHDVEDSEDSEPEPPRHNVRKRVKLTKRGPYRLKCNIPFQQDLEYVQTHYSGYGTAIMLRGVKDGNTICLSFDMMREIKKQMGRK